jgi:hypothetical protein
MLQNVKKVLANTEPSTHGRKAAVGPSSGIKQLRRSKWRRHSKDNSSAIDRKSTKLRSPSVSGGIAFVGLLN